MPQISKSATESELPAAIKKSFFTIDDQQYGMLRYKDGWGPSLNKTIEVVNGIQDASMLTLAEFRGRFPSGSSARSQLNAHLKHGDWGYLRNKWSEERSVAAWFGRGRGRGDGDLYYYDVGGRPDIAARVALFKVGSKQTAPLLRPER